VLVDVRRRPMAIQGQPTVPAVSILRTRLSSADRRS